MKRFALGQRVLVKAVDVGPGVVVFVAPRLGTVTRLRYCDERAWVALEQREHGSRVHPFPADDATRSTHVLADPELCEPLSKSVEKRIRAQKGGTQ